MLTIPSQFEKFLFFMISASVADKSFVLFLHNDPEQSYMKLPRFEYDYMNLIPTHDVIKKTHWNVNLISLRGPKGAFDVSGLSSTSEPQ